MEIIYRNKIRCHNLPPVKISKEEPKNFLMLLRVFRKFWLKNMRNKTWKLSILRNPKSFKYFIGKEPFIWTLFLNVSCDMLIATLICFSYRFDLVTTSDLYFSRLYDFILFFRSVSRVDLAYWGHFSRLYIFKFFEQSLLDRYYCFD